jgi:hypothetical protein
MHFLVTIDDSRLTIHEGIWKFFKPFFAVRLFILVGGAAKAFLWASSRMWLYRSGIRRWTCAVMSVLKVVSSYL